MHSFYLIFSVVLNYLCYAYLKQYCLKIQERLCFRAGLFLVQVHEYISLEFYAAEKRLLSCIICQPVYIQSSHLDLEYRRCHWIRNLIFRRCYCAIFLFNGYAELTELKYRFKDSFMLFFL